MEKSIAEATSFDSTTVLSSIQDIAQFGDDILREQASRTQEVNEYIEMRQVALYEQLASIEHFGCTAENLAETVRAELEELAGRDKWH